MAALENITEQSRQEMDILDALEEIKDRSARNAKIDIDTLIAAKDEAKKKLLAERAAKQQAEQDAADDAAVQAAFAGGSVRVKRIRDSSSDEEPPPGDGPADVGAGPAPKKRAASKAVKSKPNTSKQKSNWDDRPVKKGVNLAGLIKRRPAAAAPKNKAPAGETSKNAGDSDSGSVSGLGLGLIGDYGSSSD